MHTQSPAIHQNVHFSVPMDVTPAVSAPGKQFLAVTVWIRLTPQILG